MISYCLVVKCSFFSGISNVSMKFGKYLLLCALKNSSTSSTILLLSIALSKIISLSSGTPNIKDSFISFIVFSTSLLFSAIGIYVSASTFSSFFSKPKTFSASSTF